MRSPRSHCVFFKRNQGLFPKRPVDLDNWSLTVDGLVDDELELKFADILGMPKVEMANTLDCSGNSRSLLSHKASGNPWTIGGVGNAIWGGIWLKGLLNMAGIRPNAKHVCFEGFDIPKCSRQL